MEDLKDMKTKSLLTVFLFLALLLVPPAQAAPPTVIRMQIDGVIAACNGEGVHITGVVTQRLWFTIVNDITHAGLRLTGHLEGEGLTSGTTYNVNVLQNLEANLTFSPTGELNLVTRLTLISRGGEPDFHLKASQHLSINANGELVGLIHNIKQIDTSGRR